MLSLNPINSYSIFWVKYDREGLADTSIYSRRVEFVNGKGEIKVGRVLHASTPKEEEEFEEDED